MNEQAENNLKSIQSIYEDAVELLLEYVKHMPGHKNSDGEDAPWVIINHKTGKVISSHKTKAAAKKHLQQMHIFKK